MPSTGGRTGRRITLRRRLRHGLGGPLPGEGQEGVREGRFPYERLMYSQLAAGERSVSTEQAIELVALAEVARHEPRSAGYLRTATSCAGYREALAGTEFLDAFDRFLDSYGHRGRYESDWALPRYREDPSPLLYAIGVHLQGLPEDLSAREAARAREAADAWRDFESRLTWWQRHWLLNACAGRYGGSNSTMCGGTRPFGSGSRALIHPRTAPDTCRSLR